VQLHHSSSVAYIYIALLLCYIHRPAAMECTLSHAQIMESSKTLSFLGRRSLVPRPLSEATDIETDFEDDDDESSPLSMESMDNDSQTTVSDGLQTPASAVLEGFEFHFDQKPTVKGPNGPHLFRASSAEPVTEQSQDLDFYLNMSPVHDAKPRHQKRSLTSLNNAVAELDETQVRSWSPRQVASWMREAGFDSSVVEKFLIHDISGVVLLDLQFEDLRELDITSYGKRHRVMSSIQHLRNSSMLSVSPVSSSSLSRSSSRRRARQQRQKTSDDISPAESVSIVAIEQLLPKPHKCSKGENCSKWQKQQRKLQKLREEFPIETENSVIRPTSEVVPSVVASSDVLGQSQMPTIGLSPEKLSEVRPRDPQENVRQFLSLQHMDTEAPSQSKQSVHLSENLRHLPKLTIPAEVPALAPFTPRSTTPAHRTRTPGSALRHHAKVQLQSHPYHYGGVASPVDLYRVDTPLSTTDIPVTAMPVDPLDRETSQSVPPNMRYGDVSTPLVADPVQRPQSAQPRHHRRHASFVPSVATLVESPTVRPSHSPSSSTLPESELVSGIAHSGPMRKRKTTKLFCHEWQDHHCTLTGTQLAVHKDEAAAKRASQALEQIDVDDYAVAVSSLASSSKLSAAFKKSILGGASKAGMDEKAFAFSLIPAEGKRQFFNDSKKSHHFSVKTRDERIDWMREIMLAKALKKGKAMGSDVRISGNLI
jgi:SAM domain (Sterile alpha motif)/PH domain